MVIQIIFGVVFANYVVKNTYRPQFKTVCLNLSNIQVGAHTHTHTHTQVERQTDRQTDRQIDRQAGRLTETDTVSTSRL